ncbi:MAG: MFS transporter [Acidobacteria bacterium]|nr:MAG: MFS transporter [Acidobacteriota bacterium]
MSKNFEIRRFALVLTANACMFVFGVVLLLMGSLLPSLEVNYVQAGSLGSFPLAGILIATILVGLVLDTVGAKPVLAVALAMVAGAVGLMPSLHTYMALAIAALVYGFGGGVLNTATNALVADLSVAGRGAALNLLGFSFSLGALAAPLLMSTLSGKFGTASVLHILAIGAGVILVPVLAFRFPAPTHAGTRLADLLRVLNHPLVWLFGALLFFESGSENSMFVWAGKIVAGTFHSGPERANWALVGLSAAIGAGRLGAAFLLRVLGSRRTMLLSAAVAVTGAVVAYSSRELPVAVLGMIVIGLGLASIYPTALGVAGDRFPRQTGTVFGAIMAVSLVGGTAGPSICGALAATGLRNILWVPMISAAAVATFTILVTRDSQKVISTD